MTTDEGEQVFIFTVGDATMKVSGDLSSPNATREATITIGGQPYLTDDSVSPDGQKILMSERFGAAFFDGPHEIDLEVDNGIVSGSIDGQKLVPEPLSSQTVELASGAPLPAWSSTPSADAAAAAVYSVAGKCLDPPPIACLTGEPRCLPRIPPPDGGTDAGPQPQNGGHQGGPGCPFPGIEEYFGCEVPYAYCLAHPPMCGDDCYEAQDPVACERQCVQERLNYKKACTQQLASCQLAAKTSFSIGNECDPSICSTCCDGTSCATIKRPGGYQTSLCCIPFGGTSVESCFGYTPPTLLALCTVGNDSTCCPDGLPGSSRTCVGTLPLSFPHCCGNAGACCTPEGNDCCAGTICQGPPVWPPVNEPGSQQWQTTVACLGTCCTPTGSACNAQSLCCPINVNGVPRNATCDASSECHLPLQSPCNPGSTDECADGVACNSNGTCCAPAGSFCTQDADCCPNPGGWVPTCVNHACFIPPDVDLNIFTQQTSLWDVSYDYGLFTNIAFPQYTPGFAGVTSTGLNAGVGAKFRALYNTWNVTVPSLNLQLHGCLDKRDACA